MKSNIISLFLLCSLIMPLAIAQVQTPDASGIYFSKDDWEVACDNTRTCRVAGYQADGWSKTPFSVLITRKAGPGQIPDGEIKVAFADFEIEEPKIPSKVELRINGRRIGDVILGQGGDGKLSQAITDALIIATRGTGKVTAKAGKYVWILSGAGAAAVYLKVDDFQGRIGTKKAFIKVGPKNDDGVKPSIPVPVVTAKALPKPTDDDQAWAQKHAAQILAALPGRDECTEFPSKSDDLQIRRLSESAFIVSAVCFQAAYNFGSAYWIVNTTPPFVPRLILSDGSDDDLNNGLIFSGQKGRGIGDCWSSARWVWDGKEFVQTDKGSSGLCKRFVGGAWELPMIVTQVKN
jgi:hypothetical protein